MLLSASASFLKLNCSALRIVVLLSVRFSHTLEAFCHYKMKYM